MMIDQDVLRTGRGDVRINRAQAMAEAEDFLRRRAGFTAGVDTTDTSPEVVVVRLSRTVRPRFLSLFGVGSTRMTAVGRAQPCSGTVQGTETCTNP